MRTTSNARPTPGIEMLRTVLSALDIEDDDDDALQDGCLAALDRIKALLDTRDLLLEALEGLLGILPTPGSSAIAVVERAEAAVAKARGKT